MDVQVFRETFDAEHNGVKVCVVKEYDDYDPDLSCNGGSYFQPHFTCTASDPKFGVFEISDESCGDFGSDIGVFAKYGDGTEKAARYGSMCCDDGDFRGFKNSDFTRRDIRDAFWLLFAANVLGYSRIPVKEGL